MRRSTERTVRVIICVIPYTDVNQQLHRTGSGDPGSHPSLTDASQNWHIYSLVWEVGRLQWLIDGSVTCTVTSNVPNTPMFLIMETAVGGAGGAIDSVIDEFPSRPLDANADTLPTGPPPPPLSCASGSCTPKLKPFVAGSGPPLELGTCQLPLNVSRSSPYYSRADHCRGRSPAGSMQSARQPAAAELGARPPGTRRSKIVAPF